MIPNLLEKTVFKFKPMVSLLRNCPYAVVHNESVIYAVVQ